MRAVISEEALREALASKGNVYGIVRAEEELVQVLAAQETWDSRLQRLGRVQDTPVEGRSVRVESAPGPAFIVFEDSVPVPEHVEVVAILEELDTRRTEVVQGTALENATVFVVGAGSLGSEIVVPLAEAGVGRFVIIDPDRLDASNVSRHACDIADLGREKAVAVADLLRRRCVQAKAIREDVLERGDEGLRELVRGADLVVATTDSPEAQFATNEACVAEGVPAVFAAAYERGRGGEVVVFRPHATPCLFCCVGFRVGLGDAPALKERRAAYQAADADRLVAEPGLAVDLRFLGSVAAALALAILDPTGRRAALLKSARSFVLVHAGSAPDPEMSGLFAEPFELLYARVGRGEPCPVCGFISKKETGDARPRG